MAPVESPADALRKPKRAGGSQQKSDKQKLRSDGDDLCAICDNGGNLTCCDGGCKRSFHLLDEDSEDSKCRSMLGLNKEQAKIIIEKKDVICKNCKYKQHQCFVCGKLGSSDLSSEAEVFQCKFQDCGHFYHPKCVAELLYPGREMEASLFELQVAAGQKFRCPIHECFMCKGGENKDDSNMQFAVCRRCPTTYHRKCLPSDIRFETKDGYVQRAWDKWEGPDGRVIRLDRIVIYCTKHEIVKKLGAPERDHLVFPDSKKPRGPKVLVVAPMDEDITEEEQELHHHPSSEPASQSPRSLVATDQNQCSCSSLIDSFAPKFLFMHPQPGSCGWLGD